VRAVHHANRILGAAGRREQIRQRVVANGESHVGGVTAAADQREVSNAPQQRESRQRGVHLDQPDEHRVAQRLRRIGAQVRTAERSGYLLGTAGDDSNKQGGA
jgi:hypothetical protein